MMATPALLLGFCIGSLTGGEAQAQLADTPWPMAHHDVQHTGRSPHVGPASTPTVKWAIPFRSSLRSSPVIAEDGAVIVALKKTVYAFEPEDGSTRWDTELPGTIRRNTAAIDETGRIFIGDRANKMWALESDGDTIWDYNIGNDGDVASSAAITPSGTIIMAGSFNGIVFALAPNNGAKLWDHPSGATVAYSSPALGTDGTIYVGTTKGYLRAINPNGTFKWERYTGGRIRYAPPVVASDGTIYIGSSAGLHAVSPTGTLLWTFDTEGRVAAAPALAADGTIYVGSLGRAGGFLAAFYALEPDGDEIWRYQPSGSRNQFRGSPVVDFNGDIYVTSGEKLVSLDADGDLRWQFGTLSRRQFPSTPAIAADGTLYFAADEFYALED
jgi:outer membrane protein assembly factor BamB